MPKTEELLKGSSLSEAETLLKKKALLSKEKESRQKSNPLAYYWPHAYGCDGTNCRNNKHTHTDYFGTQYTIEGCPQYEFHTATNLSKAIFGANRSGKTTAGAVNAACHAVGYYPDWWPKDHRISKANKGRIFAETFKVADEVINTEIEKWFPKGSIKDREKNNMGVYVKYYIKHESGKTSTFDIFTYEQSSDVCESWSGNWVWFDEPPPREHRVATFRGLTDYMGYEWFTLTPLKEPWLFDEIYSNQKYANVTCDIRHNLLRKNPYTNDHIGLTPETILRYESALSHEEIQARGRGKFMFLSGRIWKMWDRRTHTFDRKIWIATSKTNIAVDGQPPSHWDRVMLIDPHDRNPHAILWVARDPEYGILYAYREAWLRGYTFRQVCEYIRDKEVESRERVKIRLMDPNFGPKNQANTGINVRDTFEKESDDISYPMKFMFANDHKELGRKAFEKLLFYDIKEPLSIINRPQFVAANDLTQCIYQTEHYIWDEFKHSDRDPKEAPKDLNSHFNDLYHYLALFKWQSMDAQVIEGPGNFYGGNNG